MIRARFSVRDPDYRPVVWPIKHPYWCTGQGDDYAVLVAYADDEEELLRNWPDADNIATEEVVEYQFTPRFPKPDWFQGGES